jgi:hypothetical protein
MKKKTRQEANEKPRRENNPQCFLRVAARLCHRFAQEHMFVWQHTSAHSQIFLPGAQRRTSQEQLEPDLYPRLQLMLSSTNWVMTLTGEQFLFCRTDCSGGGSKQRIARQIQRNNIIWSLCLRRIGIDQSVQWLGYGLGRSWVRIPEGKEKHFLHPVPRVSGFFSGGGELKQLGRQVNNSSPSSAKVTNEWRCTLATPLRSKQGQRYLFPYCV